MHICMFASVCLQTEGLCVCAYTHSVSGVSSVFSSIVQYASVLTALLELPNKLQCMPGMPGMPTMSDALWHR